VPKPERILDNLPLTYRAVGDPSALRALADAFGGELQVAENSLAAVIRAHWVGTADAGERRIADLAAIGALYGLAPRDDESVEEFREHLLRYVRTFLEGTVTVQGILRVTAEVLGLHIEDANDQLDAWWTRDAPDLVTHEPNGADAATTLLGVPAALAEGSDPSAAAITGLVPLAGTLDLTATPLLWIARDGAGATPVDLTSAAADPHAVTPAEVVDALNAAFPGTNLAEIVDGRLRLSSATTGPDSELTVADGPSDAAPTVLGLRPRHVEGREATYATITGTADLSGPVDLTDRRYLRIGVDGAHLAEVDAAATSTDPSAVTIDDIASAIDTALGVPVATHDGRLLTLTSPTPGGAGSVRLLTPAAQDATVRVFGEASTVAVGADERPAWIAGDRDLSAGVDLREQSIIRIAVDGDHAVSVDVAGADPAGTRTDEIVTAINAALGEVIASHDGRRLRLESPTSGSAGALTVEEVDGDAAELVLGLRPRRAVGAPTRTASVTGQVDLSDGVDLRARHLLALTIDATNVQVELRHGASDLRAVTLSRLAAAIDAAMGADVATHDGRYLIVVSPTPGAAGRVRVDPLVTTRRRRFVTRARVTDDAGTTLFGFTERGAAGAAAVPARLAGGHDLGAGVDLRDDRFLRIRLDDAEPVEVDCAGPRPRATTLEEVVTEIRAATGSPAAATDGRVLVLTSPSAGGAGRVELEPSRARDALAVVLGVGTGTVRGSDATTVRFVGTPDLSGGVLLPAEAMLRLAIDDATPVDVVVGDATPATRTLGQLVAAINLGLGSSVAAHDGTRLHLTSPTAGPSSALSIGAPGGPDATPLVLGVTTPRTYRGTAAVAAEVIGTVPLTSALDLTRTTFLRIRVDGGPPVTIDLSAAAADAAAVTGPEVASAVNVASDAVAVVDGDRLRLRSPRTGSASRLELLHSDVGDARRALLGDVPSIAVGCAPEPAVLEGEADLLRPVDLEGRPTLRLAIDGGPPVDIDVAGATPSATVLPEIVAAIDAVLPGNVSATDTDRLRITSPTAGVDSRVALVPLRHLELLEYPPTETSRSTPVHHAARIGVRNHGAAPATATVELDTTVGMVGPKLASLSRRWAVRVIAAVGAGGRLTLAVGVDGGVVARLNEHGEDRPVDPEDVVVESLDDDTPPAPLEVGRGQDVWHLLECVADRFDAARFDEGRFAGDRCVEEGVFDVSRFGGDGTVFARSHPRPITATATVRLPVHEAGRFVVNLPRDLDRRFGVALGDGRLGARVPESFAGAVFEPLGDPQHVLARLNVGSALVEAHLVGSVPIGWAPVTVPFRDPQRLTLGTRDQEARLYLAEPGLEGEVIEVRARHPGVWANDVVVAVRKVGPGRYDVEVAYPGSRFEHARGIVAAGRPAGTDGPTPQLPTLASELLAPGPVGVLLAKAAGIHAKITRNGIATGPPGGGAP
jgi:hypothetical protein